MGPVKQIFGVRSTINNQCSSLLIFLTFSKNSAKLHFFLHICKFYSIFAPKFHKRDNFKTLKIRKAMKKIFVMAFLALGLSAMAQHVAPLNIQIADVQIDSLRAAYFTEPAMYRASLDVLSQDLAKNADQIKAAKAELKDEQIHAKEMDGSLKDALKMTAELKKVYGKEETTLKSMQKVIEKQQRRLNSNRRLNQDARESYSQMLEKQQKELGYAIREVADRLHAVSDLETSIQNWQTSLQYFVQETVQKENEIARLELLYKQHLATLKTELKATKSMK